MMRSSSQTVAQRFKLFLQSLGLLHFVAAGLVLFLPTDVVQMSNLLQGFLDLGEGIPAEGQSAWMIFAAGYFVVQGALMWLQAERPHILGFGLTLLLAKALSSAAFAHAYFYEEPFFWFLLCLTFEAFTGLGLLWANLVIALATRPWAKESDRKKRSASNLPENSSAGPA